jgi:hypothetical protein
MYQDRRILNAPIRERAIFSTQVLWSHVQQNSDDFPKFSGAGAVFVVGFIFGQSRLVWRELRKPLSAGPKATRPARFARPGDLSGRGPVSVGQSA